ncbi:MAG: glutaminase A [Acetobacteraceae bacterium]
MEIERLGQRLHTRYQDVRDGAVASYIPELAKTPPDQFGIAIAATTGDVVAIGDATVPFTIQSISKPFMFALLLDRFGREDTYGAVGVQPSGDPFNAITLDPRTNRPFNPMVNAGAIAVAGRLCQRLGASAFDTMLQVLSDAAGRALDVDLATYESERETGHRNRAIGHLLRAAGVFDVPVDDVVDLYFRQCSVCVTATDLALMSATLANLGTNPITHEVVFHLDAVRDTLSVMFTCGMYDGAGDWACRVGLPAKSGVGGGIMAAVNRQLGIGVFSPRLDAAGNSVRGQLCCEGLAEDFGLHVFDCTNEGSSFLRAFDRR